MPYHRSTFSTQWCREASEGGISSPEASQPRQISIAVGDWIVEGGGEVWSYLGTPGGGPPADLWGMTDGIEFVDLHVSNSAPASFALHWSRGMGAVGVLDGVIVGNGVNNLIQEANNPIPITPGNQSPIAKIQFDGAILAALTAGPSTLVAASGSAFLSRNHLSWGRAEFSEFEDDAVDQFIRCPAVLNRLNETIHASSARHRLGVTSGGITRYADNCAYAAPSAHRRIFCRASDIGNQAEQIPNAIANNTPEHFRFFPQSFFRRADFVRELCRTVYDAYDIIEEDNNYQPFVLERVLRPPTMSMWYIIVDGQGYTVWFDHDGGDYRTGWEIWQNVIVPAIDQNQASMRPYITTNFQPQDGLVLSPTYQNTLFHRMRYLQYAGLLELTDGSPGLFDPLIQEGAISIA